MPYVKPGVEITQINKTQSPVLIAPELEVAIVGTPYKWVAPNKGQDNVIDGITNLTISITAVPTDFTITDMKTTFGYEPINATSIVVDLIRNGTKIRLYSDGTNHFTYDDVYRTFTFDLGARTIVSASTSYELKVDEKYELQIGFIAYKTDKLGYGHYDNVTDLEIATGEFYTWNNLGFGAKVAMQNAAHAINICSIMEPATTLMGEAGFAALDLANFWSLAVMDHDSGDAMSAKLTAWALPTVKKERIAFVNKDNSGWVTANMDSAGRASSATKIFEVSDTISNKREFITYPSLGYVTEFRHVTTVRPTFIDGSISAKHSTVINGVLAKLTQKMTGKSTTEYSIGTEITTTVWEDLVAADWGLSSKSEVQVLVPVPGYYLSAAAAGSVVNARIEQPMTNYAISGITQVHGGTDSFSEANLNTIAEGGTYIFVQDTLNSPIYCRHQLSSNVTSIELRELSITRQVDYASIYFRDILKKYAGKFDITPGFLSTVRANLKGAKQDLVRRGILADVTIGNVYQDTISPDVVRAEVTLIIKYPANYIKIDVIV